MFAWRLFHNRVPTDDQLRLCGLCVVSACPLCLQSDEIIAHLFFLCMFSQQLWGWLTSLFRVTFPIDGDLVSL